VVLLLFYAVLLFRAPHTQIHNLTQTHTYIGVHSHMQTHGHTPADMQRHTNRGGIRPATRGGGGGGGGGEKKASQT
jgi:hypothetical protein